MRKFISTVMERIYNDFRQSIRGTEQLCCLDDVRYDRGNIPDYNNTAIRQLYILRYFPAYLVEYYDIYLTLLQEQEIEYLHVLSLGCGCGIDYYGLILACDESNQQPDVIYTGVDAVDWPYRDCMRGEEFEFIKVDLGEWEQFDWPLYNVILFPKSIGEFTIKGFKNLKRTVARSEFNENRIFVVASLRAENKEADKKRVDEIKKIFLEQHGYTCESDVDYYYDSSAGIVTEFPDFKYPDHILDYITSLQRHCTINPEDYECLNCSIDRYPILKLSYFYYRIIILER
ncbi:MAG: hypothetical protein ABFD08_14060 [Syntrophomonas sp.]